MDSRPTGYARQSEDDNENCAPQMATSSTIRMKNKAAEIGQGAADKIDRKREKVATALESAATKLENNADCLPGGENVSRLAHRTADRLQDTADYLREHDTRAVFSGVQRFVRNHPAESLVVAAATGFLLGRAFRRGDYRSR